MAAGFRVGGLSARSITAALQWRGDTSHNDKNGGSMKDHGAHFRKLIESHLPDNSRTVMLRGGPDIIILATWSLPGDPFRPAKRSRMIRIVISEEAIQDYAAGTDGVRLASDQRFTNWLRHRLSGFDPNHDAPLGVEPPSVTWPLSTLDLNG
jgi:hypothetical protein